LNECKCNRQFKTPIFFLETRNQNHFRFEGLLCKGNKHGSFITSIFNVEMLKLISYSQHSHTLTFIVYKYQQTIRKKVLTTTHQSTHAHHTAHHFMFVLQFIKMNVSFHNLQSVHSSPAHWSDEVHTARWSSCFELFCSHKMQMTNGRKTMENGDEVITLTSITLMSSLSQTLHSSLGHHHRCLLP